MSKTREDSAELGFHALEACGAVYDYRNIIPRSFTTEQSQESVCGTDERRKVVDTSALPHKAICKLYMTTQSGRSYVGTGWLSGPNKVYTAGHNVYAADEGGWMRSIVVIPALAGLSSPYGEFVSTSLAATQAWRKAGSKRYDMGAIKLSADLPHTDFLEPVAQDGNAGVVCGYAQDRDQGLFQYSAMDSIRRHKGSFFYQADTNGGMSGAPLMLSRSKAIGIHNYGGCDNRASALYASFIRAIEDW